ncbi:restriction endonuclease subunit S [Actinomadura formosensis]|uniref:restriction endonuclease subunit S n=1 Tax=Actinomadura formosensis TaxID=60706 RepID=UPI003D8D5C16
MKEAVNVSIGDVVKIIGGGTPVRSRSDYYGGDIPWVTPKDMKSWEIKSSQIAITQLGLDSSTARVAPADSVLIVVRSGVLKHTVPVGINRIPVAINQDMKALICSESILPDYLARLIKALSGTILKWVRATTADNFPIERLRDLQVALPHVDKQRRIVNVLNQADALRAKRWAAIALLDDLTQSIFLDMFGDPVANERGWNRVRFEDLLEGIDSGKSPTCLDRPAAEGEWGVLKLGAVTSCRFKPEENKALPTAIAPVAKHEVRPGDLLFSRKNTRELVAACALVGETPPQMLLPDLIFRFNFKSDAPVDKRYIQQLLVNRHKRRKVQELASGSAGSMPNISKTRLLGLDIELPPLELQQQFSKRVRAVEESRRTHQASLRVLDDLFGSLQQRAFRGELWDD